MSDFAFDWFQFTLPASGGGALCRVGGAEEREALASVLTWAQAEGLHPRDYVTIVPAGADDGAYGDYHRMEGDAEGELRAPAEPGLYEVRLQLDTGDRVLARTPVEVVDADVTVSAPAQVVVGSAFPVADDRSVVSDGVATDSVCAVTSPTPEL